MLLPQILLLCGVALALRGLAVWKGGVELRAWLIFISSVLCLYWLQPAAPVRNLDFWLPTATLALAAFGWLVTAPPEVRLTRSNFVYAAVLAGIVLLVALTRFIGGGDWFLQTRPPTFGLALSGLVLLITILSVVALSIRRREAPSPLVTLGIILLIGLLVAIKSPTLALAAARGLRSLVAQDPALASALDIRWLGFSYICFRLIHTLRDRQTGRLPESDLRAYISYVVFFPSLAAGPIDRLERFQDDFCQPAARPGDPRNAADLTEAGRRIATGLFKKFAVADTLALIALNSQNALQARGSGWLWLMLYAYSFQIYFDFSGYTDIAIGMGRILGITLPENFTAPYRKPNLTQFWNSWHMSLTLWFRGYFFNPLVRFLRGQVKAGPTVVLLITQLATMLLIGLWHGITWNFAIWGLWHGLGLFIQNRWTDFIRPRISGHAHSPGVQRFFNVASTLLTFHYVTLGWVWFVLPADVAGQVVGRLFGVGF